MRLSGYPYRWRVVALLFFLSALNYLDRQTLSGRSSRCASGADIIMVVAFAVVSAFRRHKEAVGQFNKRFGDIHESG